MQQHQNKNVSTLCYRGFRSTPFLVQGTLLYIIKQKILHSLNLHSQTKSKYSYIINKICFWQMMIYSCKYKDTITQQCNEMMFQRGRECPAVTLLEATSFSSYLPCIHAILREKSASTMAGHQRSQVKPRNNVSTNILQVW